MTGRISYVNGRFVLHGQASVSIEDRGYLFGDGVYEVMLVQKNTIVNQQDHMTRLRRSLQGLAIPYEVHAEDLSALILELLKQNAVEEGIVYLQVSRGVAPRNHAFPTPALTPSMVMMFLGAPVQARKDYEQGVSAITQPDMRWKRRDLKTISLLPNILAKEEAAKQQAAEAILVEEPDVITEGSSSNVFIVDAHHVLHTHPDNGAILGGVTRKNILRLARTAGIVVQEEPFTLSQMLKAREVFLTSTTKYALPVTQINGVKVGDGKVGDVTRKIMAMYEAFIEGQLYKDHAVYHAKRIS